MTPERYCAGVAALLAEGSADGPPEVTLSTRVVDLAGADSLLFMELVAHTEDLCDAVMSEGLVVTLETVGDLYAFLDAHLSQR